MGRGLHKSTMQLVEAAQAILAEQQPMTIRQLFYQLVSRQNILNSLRDYQKVSRIMTDARERGEIPFQWIVDRSRPVYFKQAWDDAGQFMRAAARGYHREYWQEQDNYVEVWCEKDAVTGSIQDVCEKWGVKIRVCRGFNSTTRVHEIAEELGDYCDKEIYILYLGDHDPSGRCIEEEGSARVEEAGATFDLERIAIHQEDIGKYKLPPLKIKTKDSRAGGFIHRYGVQCVELDALSVKVLRQRLEEKITSFLDMAAWDRAMRIERVEFESVERICKRWKGTINKKIEKIQAEADE